MIKRVFAFVLMCLCLCPVLQANKEVDIKLDNKERVYVDNLGYAYLTFEYLYNVGNNARVRVSLENITQASPLAMMVFGSDIAENKLKDGHPKIEFDNKTYPGQKGTRYVRGCEAEHNSVNIITQAEIDTLFVLDVPLTSSLQFTLPLYIAKYNAGKLYKKGKYNINYKITEENIYDYHIQVVSWDVNDPLYVQVKNEVDSFVAVADEASFCNNPKHKPSLEEQQQPYIEKRDSLENVINDILNSNSEWMSDYAPHKAYTKLLAELNGINLDKNLTDCGNHRIVPEPPKCKYCSLSAQEIYYRLDEIYQQLHGRKLSKDEAVKRAKALYNCYQKHTSRKKDSSYGAKINKFYDRIIGY